LFCFVFLFTDLEKFNPKMEDRCPNIILRALKINCSMCKVWYGLLLGAAAKMFKSYD
jgi:hypothetical protein